MEKTNERQIGRNVPGDYQDYVDFINYVFGFDGKNRHFPKLLPKLYRPELCPQASNYVAVEKGKYLSAIGAYDIGLQFGGDVLPCRGIGNVAVHPAHRGEGWMKTLLTMAVDDMVREGVALSVLGGQRQRYAFFGYESAGAEVTFTIGRGNLRRLWGEDRKPSFSAERIEKDNQPALDYIYTLLNPANNPLYCPLRKRTELFAILSSWEAGIWLISDGEKKPVGYAVVGGGRVSELNAEPGTDMTLVAECLCAACGTLTYCFPLFARAVWQALVPLSDGAVLGNAHNFCVLDYERVLRAALTVAAGTKTPADGSLVVRIHGRAGEENLRLSVENARATVEKTDEPPRLELEHLEAMELFFSAVAAKRGDLPPCVQTWLPLPLWVSEADNV